jgi:sugar lactone lactonase YvrE
MCFAFINCTSSTDETTEENAVKMQTPSLELAWESDTTLLTPESVLYDAANDFYYVSCINGVPPDAKDGDGYIAKMDANGKIITDKWATGMSAPKGMALVGNTLYVADISKIVMIDVATGKISGEKEIEEAAFLNDMDAASDGTVYFTDSGTKKAYSMKNGEVKELFTNDDLAQINGVYVDGDNLTFASMESGNVVKYSLLNNTATVVSDSLFGGDGIKKYKDGYIISNWNGEVYHLTADWKKTKILDTQRAKLNAADIEVVESKNLLLVPTFFGNKVMAYKIK